MRLEFDTRRVLKARVSEERKRRVRPSVRVSVDTAPLPEGFDGTVCAAERCSNAIPERHPNTPKGRRRVFCSKLCANWAWRQRQRAAA